ncbi:hypothetical protein A1WU_00047 [Escherichia coli KTE108]|nr:hypothetical protein A1WU_00047 [Escherichia coli KTE108]
MEGKTETFIKTSVDDNGMWLLTVPAGSTGDETVVVVVRRVEECRYGSEDSPGAYLSITSSLTLYGDGQGTPQTIVAKFVPGTVELFSVEFMLKEFWHCCKVSDEAAFCLIQRPYISKTLLTRRISPRGSP